MKARIESPEMEFFNNEVTRQMAAERNPYLPTVAGIPDTWIYDGYCLPREVTVDRDAKEIKMLLNEVLYAESKWTRKKRAVREREFTIAQKVHLFRVQQMERGVEVGPLLDSQAEQFEDEVRQSFYEKEREKHERKEALKAERKQEQLMKEELERGECVDGVYIPLYCSRLHQISTDVLEDLSFNRIEVLSKVRCPIITGRDYLAETLCDSEAFGQIRPLNGDQGLFAYLQRINYHMREGSDAASE